MSYDPDNIFAKLLRGEIPSKKIFEDEYVLVIHDAFPQVPIHALILPKKPYISMSDFSASATDAEIVALNRAIGKTVEILGLKENGYRVIANAGDHGGQEIPHLHVHILGGEKLPPMIAK